MTRQELEQKIIELQLDAFDIVDFIEENFVERKGVEEILKDMEEHYGLFPDNTKPRIIISELRALLGKDT